jgi:leucyl-tRNA synthetase
LKKIWHAYLEDDGNIGKFQENLPSDCQRILNETIEKVGDDIENLKFNTAISQMMICLNTMREAGGFGKSSAESFIKILAPFAPHIAEELWARLGNRGSIVDAGWPQCDVEKFVPRGCKIPIQVNGKVRSECFIDDVNMPDDAIFTLAMGDENIGKYITGKNIIKKVYVKGKIVSFVVK